MSLADEMCRMVGELERERDEAQAEADRLGEANSVLCDDIAEAGARIRVLEGALGVVLEMGLFERPSLVRVLRAALLGMDARDEGIDEAWRAWVERQGRAA